MGRPSHSTQSSKRPAGASGKHRLSTIDKLLKASRIEKELYERYYRLYTRTVGDVVNRFKHDQYKFLARELPNLETFGKDLQKGIVSNMGYQVAAAATGGFAGQIAANQFRRDDQVNSHSEGVRSTLIAWEKMLFEMVDLRRSLGSDLERYYAKVVKDRAQRLAKAEEGFSDHLRVLRKWADTMDRVDQTIAGVDTMKTIKDYHDRAKTVVSFFRQPVQTIIDETGDKLKSGYRNTLTGDKDEWDVIKKGIRMMGRYLGTLDWAPEGYENPRDIVVQLDKSGQGMERWGREVRRYARAMKRSNDLRKAGNIPLVYVDIR